MIIKQLSVNSETIKMTKTVLERIDAGEEVTKEECTRSVSKHVSDMKILVEKFVNDNKNFELCTEESFKNICVNTMTSCVNKQDKLIQMIAHLYDRLEDPTDNTLREET